jgi:malate dehydrogenase (oxaloacetate-decarboxylating)(NADP+)
MAVINDRPIVFALSNPTSKAECTAADAYAWSDGRAVFASGSPFEPVTVCGHTLAPGQGNNVYIFPGIGLAVTACSIQRVTDGMFLAAARKLADSVTAADLESGCIYPGLERIREVSLSIAVEIARVAYAEGLAAAEQPSDLRAFIEAQVFQPIYRSYV